MKLKITAASALTTALLFSTSIGHSAAIKTTENKVTPVVANTSVERSSVIEKAIHQQKTETKLHTDDDLKMLRAIKVGPTQSFLASQNQSFTRFVQALFASSNS